MCLCVCVSVCVSVCDYCHVPSVDLVSIIYTKPVVSPECEVYMNSEAAASDSEIHLVPPVVFFQGPLHPIVQTDYL